MRTKRAKDPVSMTDDCECEGGPVLAEFARQAHSDGNLRGPEDAMPNDGMSGLSPASDRGMPGLFARGAGDKMPGDVVGRGAGAGDTGSAMPPGRMGGGSGGDDGSGGDGSGGDGEPPKTRRCVPIDLRCWRACTPQ